MESIVEIVIVGAVKSSWKLTVAVVAALPTASEISALIATNPSVSVLQSSSSHIVRVQSPFASVDAVSEIPPIDTVTIVLVAAPVEVPVTLNPVPPTSAALTY